MTIIKRDSGTSGLLYDRKEHKKYYIFPYDENKSALIEMNDSLEQHICTNEYENIDGSSEGGCDEVCPGHVKILFLLSDGAQDWLVHTNNNATYFNLMLNELKIAWNNSQINNSVSFDWAQTDYSISKDENSCQDAAIAIAENPDIKEIRNNYNADFVVFLASPEKTFTATTACVAEIGPDQNRAFSIIPVDNCLSDYTFVHEIGHLYGAQHEWSPHQFGDCAYAHEINFTWITIMGSGLDRIQYYSDPEIKYRGWKTGQISQDYADHNNAGRIRETGCVVSEFKGEELIHANVSVTYEKCLLNLGAYVSESNPDYTYNWHWSYNGLFTQQYPGSSLGSGPSISVQEPVSDPCVGYFIKLTILYNSNIIASQVIYQDGGICTEHVASCDESASALSNDGSDDQPYMIESTHQINSGNKSFERSGKIEVFNILGQKIGRLNNAYNLRNLSLKSGIYIIIDYKTKRPTINKIYYHGTIR